MNCSWDVSTIELESGSWEKFELVIIIIIIIIITWFKRTLCHSLWQWRITSSHHQAAAVCCWCCVSSVSGGKIANDLADVMLSNYCNTVESIWASIVWFGTKFSFNWSNLYRLWDPHTDSSFDALFQLNPGLPVPPYCSLIPILSILTGHARTLHITSDIRGQTVH